MLFFMAIVWIFMPERYIIIGLRRNRHGNYFLKMTSIQYCKTIRILLHRLDIDIYEDTSYQKYVLCSSVSPRTAYVCKAFRRSRNRFVGTISNLPSKESSQRLGPTCLQDITVKDYEQAGAIITNNKIYDSLPSYLFFFSQRYTQRYFVSLLFFFFVFVKC